MPRIKKPSPEPGGMTRFEKWSLGLAIGAIIASAAAAFGGAWAAYQLFDPADKHGIFQLNAIDLKCPPVNVGGKFIENYDLNVEFKNIGARPISKSEILLSHDDVPPRAPTLEAGSLVFEQQTKGPKWDRYVISTSIDKDATLSLHATGSFGIISLVTDSGQRISYYLISTAPGKCAPYYPPVDVVGPIADETSFDNGSETIAHPSGASATAGGAPH